MNVLYTSYLSKFELGYHSFILFPTVIGILFGLLCLGLAEDKKVIVISLIMIIIGLLSLGIAVVWGNTQTNYVEYKAVTFDDAIPKELLESYTIKSIKGDIYILEPREQMEE